MHWSLMLHLILFAFIPAIIGISLAGWLWTKFRDR